MAPLLIDAEGRAAYTPWSHRDMATLVARLPTLTAGASAWIRRFETETSGDLLTLGDIRAIIGRAHSARRIIELETLTKTEALPDNTPFDAYRNLFWESLRALFPTDAGRVGISGLTIKPEESIFQYIERAEGLWTDNNDCPPHSSKLATQTFQRAIIQGLPPTVQRRLKTVVALHSKPWTEWVDHLDHHHRLEEDKRLEKDDDYEELKKQLVRMQIKEQAEKSQQPQYQNQGHRGGRGGRGRGGPQTSPWTCFHCGQQGHWIRNCPLQRRDQHQMGSPPQPQYPPHSSREARRNHPYPQEHYQQPVPKMGQPQIRVDSGVRSKH